MAEYTALAEPRNRVIAVSRRLFLKYKADLHVVPWPEENSVSLQVWSYDPAKISSGKAVDPLSLYLSFLDETDERVVMAREQLLKGIAWFRG